MDFGQAKFISTKNLNKQLRLIESERITGTSYKFYKKTDKSYVCASCKAFGRYRTVTVVNGRIIGTKHPEDDHHPDCRPIPQASLDVLELDRDMRSVRGGRERGLVRHLQKP